MAKDKHIIVNRGGRLFVNGGRIFGRTPECRWGGILVHGKADVVQPETDDAKNKYHQLTSEDAGVVWLKDAEIHWAQVGISTRGSGSLTAYDYFGGLVMVDNSDFIDNWKAVEFMWYAMKNKSYFHTCHIESRHANPDYNTKVGVSIWGCRDIDFSYVYFTGLKQFGIYGIGFNATIDHCYFNGVLASSGSAIRIETTMPNTVENQTIITNCEFENYNKDIVAYSVPNYINGLIVQNNMFFPAAGPFSAGVQILGESSFDISYDNTFTGKFSPIFVRSTAGNYNTITCNKFETSTYAHVTIQGDNSGLRVLGNMFYNPSPRQIFLNGNGTNKATIFERQGTPFYGASNCFQTPTSAILADDSETETFHYYIHNLSDPLACELVTDNLSDEGVNNYYLHDALDAHPCEGSPTPVSFILDDLADARDSSAARKLIFLADSTDAEKYNRYLDALAHQDSVVKFVITLAYDNNDLDKVDSLMIGEDGKGYARAVVGLRTQRGDVAGADSLLQTIPVDCQDDSWFQDIMAINFELYGAKSADTLYKLTSGEEELLKDIALADNSIMSGYACAILSLCAGYICDSDFDTTAEERRYFPRFSHPMPAAADDKLIVYPNPADGNIDIDGELSNDQIINVDIYDFMGRLEYAQEYIGSIGKFHIRVKLLDPGIHFVIVRSSHAVLLYERVINRM